MLTQPFVQDYIDLLKSDEARYAKDADRLKERIEKESMVVRGGPVPIPYQGFFYDQKDEARFHYITDQMMKITHKVTEEYLTNPAYRKLFGFDPRLEELILVDPGYDIPVTVGRYDLFYQGDDKYKFIEFNTDGTSGMNEDRFLSRLLFETQGMQDFKKLYDYENVDLMTPLVEEYLSLYEEITGHKKPNVAIVDILDKGTTSEFLAFQKVFEDQGVACEILDIRDLDYKDGRLQKDGFVIDLMYRRFVVAEFMKVYDQVQAFRQAYQDQAFLMFGSFRNQMMHSKIVYAVFYHEMTKKILTEEENAFIEKVIPYTKDFNQEEDLIRALENKDRYIFKPKEGYASQGIFTGRTMDQEAFEARVRQVFDSHYIIQEYYQQEPVPYVEFVDGQVQVDGFGQNVGLMIYNEKFIAPYTRIGRDALISNEYDYYTAPGVRILGKKQ